MLQLLYSLRERGSNSLATYSVELVNRLVLFKNQMAVLQPGNCSIWLCRLEPGVPRAKSQSNGIPKRFMKTEQHAQTGVVIGHGKDGLASDHFKLGIRVSIFIASCSEKN